jgi:hypothetical protein
VLLFHNDALEVAARDRWLRVRLLLEIEHIRVAYSFWKHSNVDRRIGHNTIL